MSNPPRFEAIETKSGEWYWRLKGANGETLAHSETYPDRQTAMAGIEASRRIVEAGAEVRTYRMPPPSARTGREG